MASEPMCSTGFISTAHRVFLDTGNKCLSALGRRRGWEIEVLTSGSWRQSDGLWARSHRPVLEHVTHPTLFSQTLTIDLHTVLLKVFVTPLGFWACNVTLHVINPLTRINNMVVLEEYFFLKNRTYSNSFILFMPMLG